MAEDLTLKNVPKSVIDAINSATTQSDLRELMLQSMSRAGLVVRTQQDEFDIRRQPESAAQPAAPFLPAALPAHELTHWRVIYPHANDRYELTGASEAELDEKEARIRALYGQQ